jgi:L-fuconolactonase
MIDSHHHFWWTDKHTYIWPAEVGGAFDRNYAPDDLKPELERCGVKGTVLVQVLHQVGGETEECLDLCKEVDFVRGVVGWLPLANPDETSQALERLRQSACAISSATSPIRAGCCRTACSIRSPCARRPGWCSTRFR